MNITSLIKLVFGIAIVALLVLTSLNNSGQVDFTFPLVLRQSVKQPAVLMYFGFFAVGLVTGAVLSIGNKKAKKS
jgi:uncharacterized integral membrane protein